MDRNVSSFKPWQTAGFLNEVLGDKTGTFDLVPVGRSDKEGRISIKSEIFDSDGESLGFVWHCASKLPDISADDGGVIGKEYLVEAPSCEVFEMEPAEQEPKPRVRSRR